LAQVVAFAATGIEAAGSCAGGQVGQHGTAGGCGDRLVVAGVEEALAGGNHLLAVARIARALVLDWQQVGVALAGDVEAVAGSAMPGGTVAMQRRAVQRAGQRLERGDVHGLDTEPAPFVIISTFLRSVATWSRDEIRIPFRSPHRALRKFPV
jgi:hypothetical protein